MEVYILRRVCFCFYFNNGFHFIDLINNQVQHENVISYIDYFDDEMYGYLITEFHGWMGNDKELHSFDLHLVNPGNAFIISSLHYANG